MNTKLIDLSLLDASDFLKAPGSLDTLDNESFDVMGKSLVADLRLLAMSQWTQSLSENIIGDRG